LAKESCYQSDTLPNDAQARRIYATGIRTKAEELIIQQKEEKKAIKSRTVYRLQSKKKGLQNPGTAASAP